MNGAFRTDEYGRGRLNIYEAVRPLSVFITGPSQVNAGQSYTWTSNASGGTPSYTYEWYWRSQLTYPNWNFYTTTQSPDLNFTFQSHMVPSGSSTAWLRVVVQHQGFRKHRRCLYGEGLQALRVAPADGMRIAQNHASCPPRYLNPWGG